jgi:iron complex transport system ATP-binding protein
MTLRAENLGVRLGDRWLLRGVDLDLASGELFSVLGPNGAGKSTLLRALASELRPSEGRVLLDDRPLDRWPGGERGRRVAVLSQSVSLAFGFTALEVATMGRIPHRGTATELENRAVAMECLDRAGAAHLAGRSCLTLSGGERQRVHLARVLAQAYGIDGAKPILLLDEPLTSLDIAHQLEILQLLRRLVDEREMTVFMVIHDLNQAARYSDRILVLNEGRPHACGSPREVLDEDLLHAVYGVRTHVTRHPRGDCPHVVIA